MAVNYQDVVDNYILKYLTELYYEQVYNWYKSEFLVAHYANTELYKLIEYYKTLSRFDELVQLFNTTVKKLKPLKQEKVDSTYKTIEKYKQHRQVYIDGMLKHKDYEEVIKEFRKTSLYLEYRKIFKKRNSFIQQTQIIDYL